MKRRDFLKNSALASSLFLVPGFIRATNSGMFTSETYKRLIVIQLAGGNDGLNAIVPFRNDIYYRSRPKLAIRKNGLHTLNDELGFHESLLGLKKLFDAGELSIINSVGYPNPDRSHFRSTDIWHTASASDEVLKEGWLGRYMDAYGSKSYHTMELGDSMSLIMKGQNRNGFLLQNAALLQKISGDPYFDHLLRLDAPAHLDEHNMGYLYQTLIDAKQSAAYIHEKSQVQQSNFDYGNSKFGQQLQTIGQFIHSGIDTKIFFASLGGFDTHANQLGKQANLMKTYADGVYTLVQDLKSQGHFEDTLIMTFSEFGRRVSENAASGTDHGAANNVFVIGSKLLKPGLFNPAPRLDDLDDNGDLKYEIDFRSIYGNLLTDWMGVAKGGVLTTDVPKVRIV